MSWDFVEHLTRRWPVELDWAVAFALAWIAGELAARHLRLPRISAYGLTGFLLADGQLGLLPSLRGASVGLLANVAMGLILFELGYRINLRWLRSNPYIGLTSLVEAAASFLAVFLAALWLGLAPLAASLVAALALSTSPAAVLSVLNEQASSGQVTERTVHLTAFNCVLAILLFKALSGIVWLERSGDLVQAAWHSIFVFVFSASIGAVVGLAVPKALQLLGAQKNDPTTPFAVVVVALVIAMQWLEYSPAVAALAFGMVGRSRRTVLIHPERGFGPLGATLMIVLFVYTSGSLDSKVLVAGAGGAIVLILARAAAKVSTIWALARASGISSAKGLYNGVAMMPLSAFVLLLLEPETLAAQSAIGGLASLTAMVFILEIVGPAVTRWAVVRSGEASRGQEG